MRILFLSGKFPPQNFESAYGAAFYLARGLKEAGHEVFVITTCQEKSEETTMDYQGLKVFRIYANYDLRWRPYVGLYNPQTVGKVEKIIKEIRPDVTCAYIIHTFLSYHCLKIAKKYSKAVFLSARDVMAFNYGKLATKRYLEHFDCRTYWLDHIKQAGKRYNPLRNLIIKRYLRYCDKIFANSYAFKKSLEQNGIKNVDVSYTGIDVTDWQVSPELVEKFKMKHDLRGKKVVFFGGRISGLKGVEQINQAMAKVKEEIPEAVLLVAGGKDMGWLTGDELMAAYHASDIVVVPSVYLDPFPRTNLEAMACKKPVVTTCYGGSPEAVVDGVTGYIVNPLDIDNLAEKIIDLLKNPEKAKQFGEAGYERIKEKFSVKELVRQRIEEYSSRNLLPAAIRTPKALSRALILSDKFPPQNFESAYGAAFDSARTLQKSGHEVFVITTCQDKSEETIMDYQGLKVFRIYANFHPGWRAYLSLYNPQTIGKVREIIKEIKPDFVWAYVIHGHLSYHCLKIAKKYSKAVFLSARDVMAFNYGKLATKRYLEHFDCRTYWLDHIKQAGKRYNPLRNLIIKRYLRYCDKIFAVSHALKIALEQNGIKNVGVNHTGINVLDWQVAPELVEGFKEKHGLFNKKVIFFGGRISGLKGVEQINQAMAKVKEEIPEAVLLVAGGKDMGWLTGDELRAAYHASDIVVVPSTCFDSFPRSNLEAMACQKPVIATCYGGSSEIVQEGVTGFIINPFNIGLMAEKIIDLLKNPEKARRFGQAGYQRISSQFLLQNQVNEILKYYDKNI